MKRHLQRAGVNTLWGAALVNILWYLAAKTLNINALPSPIAVYAALDNVWQQSMQTHLWASLWRITAGITIATLLGTAIALWMVQSKQAGRILGAFVYFAYPIPKLALLPVVMLLAGLGDTAKIILIVLIIVFQIIVNLRDGLKNIPPESYLIATSLGADRRQLWRHIMLPAVLPDLLSTLRVATGTAISVLFVTETYGTDRGMGYFIIDAWMRINYIEMYAGIVILSMTGFLLFLLTDLLEAHLCQWKSDTKI